MADLDPDPELAAYIQEMLDTDWTEAFVNDMSRATGGALGQLIVIVKRLSDQVDALNAVVAELQAAAT